MAQAGLVEQTSPLQVRPVVLVARDRRLEAVGRALADGLAGMGIDGDVVRDGEASLEADTLLLLRGTPNWFPDTWRRLAALDVSRRPRSILWLGEPLPMPAAAGLRGERRTTRELAKVLLRDSRRTDPGSNAGRLRRLAGRRLPDRLVVTSEGAAEFLRAEGIAAAVVPYGCTPAHGADLGLERDVDVLFLGTSGLPRRRRALRRLRRAGVRILVAGGWGRGGVWGDERMRLVNRSRILVHLSRYPGQFAGERFLIGMANGALVVSEPIYRPAPFVPGTHYVEATLDELPATIERLLGDDGQRTRIAAAGRAFVTTELTMARSLARVLEAAA